MDGITPKGIGEHNQSSGSNSDTKKPKNGLHNSRNVEKVEPQVTKAGSGEESEFEDQSLLGRSIKDVDFHKRNSVDSGLGSDVDSDFTGFDVNAESTGASLSTLEAIADSVLAEDVVFHTASFLSGHGKTQQKQVDTLCNEITRKFYNSSKESLSDLLDQIKSKDSQTPKHSVSHSFLLRCAILQASEENGCGIQSWEAFTHAKPPEAKGDAFWSWLEQPGSWIPEAQGAVAKYMEHSWIQALELSKAHPDQQVVAYKGGFGAGKTSHGKEAFGDNFLGSVAPDSAKKVVRKALPVSHSTAHTQGSDMAFKLFDGLIKHSMGTIVYDSSLSSANDVKELIVKSEAAAKPLKVVDITRDDKARALAVLARSIEGEDPRIPLEFIEYGAERDRKQRPDCMNTILDSSGFPTEDSKTGQEKKNGYTHL